MILAQMTKSVLPVLGYPHSASHLALDHMELMLGAHLVQRYGAARRRRGDVRLALPNGRRCERPSFSVKTSMEAFGSRTSHGSASFGDQAAFTRTFHRVVGVSPGRWRREHRRHES